MNKDRLRSYQAIKKEQEQLKHQLEKIEAAIYYPKIQRMTGMPFAKTEGNHQEDMAIYHIELQTRYKAKIEEIVAERLAIEEAIEPLTPTMRMLIRFRYIDGLKWEEVCCKMNYSWRQTHRLHAETLKRLREMTDNGEKPVYN